MAPLGANRLARLTAAEIVAALVAALVIAALGTGLGIAAVHVNDQPSQTPLQIIHPADGAGDQQFMLHRDRPYLP